MNNFSFSDVFDPSFLVEAGRAVLTPAHAAYTALWSLGFAIALFFIHRRLFRGPLYSRSFGIALGMLTVITSFVILTITSNIVLSLGMVGALSIVRFRTAVKDAIDNLYMFWAIATGIIVGAGLPWLALIEFVLVFALVLFLSRWGSGAKPYLCVFRCSTATAEKEVLDVLASSVKRHRVKARVVDDDHRELTVEVLLKKDDSGFLDKIKESGMAHSAVMMSYDGDYAG